MEASNEQKRIVLLTNFLLAKLKQLSSTDDLVEESLRLIHRNIAHIEVKDLLNHLAISERQFERRFSQTVGITPQAYIRVKRFNEAIRLMKTRQYARLTDIAYVLNFHDQSHFIREIKSFSGLTPKSISAKSGEFPGPERALLHIINKDDGFLQFLAGLKNYTLHRADHE